MRVRPVDPRDPDEGPIALSRERARSCDSGPSVAVGVRIPRTRRGAQPRWKNESPSELNPSVILLGAPAPRYKKTDGHQTASQRTEPAGDEIGNSRGMAALEA